MPGWMRRAEVDKQVLSARATAQGSAASLGLKFGTGPPIAVSVSVSIPGTGMGHRRASASELSRPAGHRNLLHCTDTRRASSTVAAMKTRPVQGVPE